MPLKSSIPALVINASCRSIRGLLLLVIYALSASTLAAQSDQVTMRAEASELLQTGLQLYQQSSKDSLKRAVQKFEQALPLYRALKDRRAEAGTLNNIGRVYHMLGEMGKAIDYYKQAFRIAHAENDLESEDAILNAIATAYDEMGETRKALDYYERTLELDRAIGNRRGEADTLYNIGRGWATLGENHRAHDNYEQALQLYRALNDRENEATLLNDIGGVYLVLGERRKAISYIEQALSLCRAADDCQIHSTMLNNIGGVYFLLGEYRQALFYLEKALSLARAGNEREYEIGPLTNLGKVYYRLDEPRKALVLFEQALLLARKFNDRKSQAILLNSIGDIYQKMGMLEKALGSYEKAFSLARASGDPYAEAIILNGIGVLYETLGERQKAIRSYEQALSLDRAINDRQNEANLHYNIALNHNFEGDLIEAKASIEAAISLVESLRTEIDNENLRSAFFASRHDYYGLYIDVLMRLHQQHADKGYDREALQVSERARARVLLEMLSEANADIKQGVSHELVGRERTLRQSLNAKALEQMTVLGGPHTDEHAKAIAAEIESLMIDLQQVETEIRQKSPRYAALTQPQPRTLEEIQTDTLDHDTLLLEYFLGPRRSYLWAVTSDSLRSYELPGGSDIEAAARRLYGLLNARNVHIRGETQAQRTARVAQADRALPSAAAALSRILLAPVAAQLGKKRLVIVADGILQYIPFAILPAQPANGGKGTPPPLIVDHEVVSLPSASTLAVLRREVAGRQPAPKTLVALADPVFMQNDERVQGTLKRANSSAPTVPAVPDETKTVRELQLVEAAEATGMSSGKFYIPRLPSSRKEAEEIAAMVPAGESRLALDFEASRELATSSELSQYRYVHFSTHGFLNSTHPELSGIVFSLVNKRGEAQDGFLRAHEVFNLRLPAEVVVLSACQTGIGKGVKGEGLVSLTRGFMYAGAPRVVVSLWSVNETGTAELMMRFYRGMLKEGKRPAEALRDAQISLMEERRWQSPFYWGAFTLQGEWR